MRIFVMGVPTQASEVEKRAMIENWTGLY